jgi:hypothetical protein
MSLESMLGPEGMSIVNMRTSSNYIEENRELDCTVSCGLTLPNLMICESHC